MKNWPTFYVIHFLIFLCLCQPLCSQGKVIIRQKKWEYTETEHFKIYHCQVSREIASVLSSLLEDIFTTTTKFYEYAPVKKIPFFIYADHNDFEQTNIVDVGEGTGGVSEALKNRFLVYNNGSVCWLKNVISHEFAHVIYFKVIYEESPILKALRLTRGIFIPLWVVEGMAEYNTGTLDATEREMVIRDMVRNKNVLSLRNLRNFNHLKPHQITPAYKISECALRFMVEEYGHDKPQKILKVLRDKLDINIAFIDSMGMSLDLFEKKFEEWVYEDYRDDIGSYGNAGIYGKKLTFDNGDNIPDFNTNPAFSPDGKTIVFISDEKGDNEIVSLDLHSGRKKVIVSGNNSKIDIIHNGRISFSPDGKSILFAGEKTHRDYLYLYDTEKESVSVVPLRIHKIKSPVYSSTENKILFIGMESVFNDIYEYNLTTCALEPITNDPEDQDSPVYSPSGSEIAFAQENRVSMRKDIYTINRKTREKKRLTDFPGDETEPVYLPGGDKILFISDENPGMPRNIYTVSVSDLETQRKTDLLTGAFSPCVSESSCKVAFSYYDNFRKDIYIADTNSIDKISGQQEPISKNISGDDKISSDLNVSSMSGKPYKFHPSLDILVPFVMYHSEYGLFVAAYWQASELFGNHEIYNQIIYLDKDELQYQFGYSFKKWRPQFLFKMSAERSEYLSVSEEIYKEKNDVKSLSVIYPLDRFNNIETEFSTRKYSENWTSLDSQDWDLMVNRYSVGYHRNNVTGKYLYERFGADTQLIFRQAFRELNGDSSYKEYVLRHEKFVPIFTQGTVVFGGLGVFSEGVNKRYFRMPLRGFSSLSQDYKYTRLLVSTLETRFPLITFESVWPSPDFFVKSLNMFVYSDAGFGYNSINELEKFSIGELHNSIGAGLRIYTFAAGYLLPATIDYAKKTTASGERWSFSLGVSLPY
ncbi:MAG: translocation protein TolB [Elusimicrobia bacterium ADurb.Bin231]|nr:MAG: translocation protein TolB [Elusimicrobia bacterium ADurb.Bin231]